MPNIIMADRALVKGIADMLKSLCVVGGYDEWKKFIGCIELLEQIASSPSPQENNTEERNNANG